MFPNSCLNKYVDNLFCFVFGKIQMFLTSNINKEKGCILLSSRSRILVFYIFLVYMLNTILYTWEYSNNSSIKKYSKENSDWNWKRDKSYVQHDYIFHSIIFYIVKQISRIKQIYVCLCNMHIWMIWEQDGKLNTICHLPSNCKSINIKHYSLKGINLQ